MALEADGTPSLGQGEGDRAIDPLEPRRERIHEREREGRPAVAADQAVDRGGDHVEDPVRGCGLVLLGEREGVLPQDPHLAPPLQAHRPHPPVGAAPVDDDRAPSLVARRLLDERPQHLERAAGARESSRDLLLKPGGERVEGLAGGGEACPDLREPAIQSARGPGHAHPAHRPNGADVARTAGPGPGPRPCQPRLLQRPPPGLGDRPPIHTGAMMPKAAGSHKSSRRRGHGRAPTCRRAARPGAGVRVPPPAGPDPRGGADGESAATPPPMDRGGA